MVVPTGVLRLALHSGQHAPDKGEAYSSIDAGLDGYHLKNTERPQLRRDERP